MIEFRVEWREAPGVRDALLARTWCLLTIEVDGQIVTRASDNREPGARNGIYGPAFPLCRWVVENWWFLHHEASPFERRYGSIDLARNPRHRAWVQRHSLLAVGEGGALPDLVLFRDGDAVAANWLQDGADAVHPFLRFANEGRARLALDDTTHGLTDFVDRVLARLDGLEAPEIDEVREDWAAISGAAPDEREICGWSARLGLDPYDPDELTDEREALLRTAVSTVECDIRNDLLDVATVDELPGDLGWIESAHHTARGAGRGETRGGPPPSRSGLEQPSAHDTGYACAEALRQHLSAAPDETIAEMRQVMHDLGWAHSPVLTAPTTPASPLDAVVEHSDSGAPVVVAATAADVPQERFRLARSLFLHHFTDTPARRLVTAAHTWDQRASRAFAAEFLAPAAALRAQVGGAISVREADDLAREYQVHPAVIQHQIQNHHLGQLAGA